MNRLRTLCREGLQMKDAASSLAALDTLSEFLPPALCIWVAPHDHALKQQLRQLGFSSADDDPQDDDYETVSGQRGAGTAIWRSHGTASEAILQLVRLRERGGLLCLHAAVGGSRLSGCASIFERKSGMLISIEPRKSVRENGLDHSRATGPRNVVYEVAGPNVETTGAKGGDLCSSGGGETVLGLHVLAGGFRLCLDLDVRRSHARYHRSNNAVARLVRTGPRRQGAEMQQGPH